VVLCPRFPDDIYSPEDFAMAVTSTAKAEWHGSIKEGKGDMHLARGGYTGEFTRASRFETGQGTNPEELLAAAHAGCFSMQLSALLSNAGHPPTIIRTTVKVNIEGGGVGINRIEISTEGVVPGVDEKMFQEQAAKAKEICPISKAVAAVKDITVTAKLVHA
jgi:osmotically inducible protein OsmC